ncbi:hypothetical protein ABW19_dt0202829 [Dactylella cylindrospora]|nr:hypothetical protein ABW19_dt0202829 [Dactylella cylindrospora]
MAFLYGTPIPVVGVLYRDSKNAVHLITYEVNLTKKAVKDPEFKKWAIESSNIDHGAKLLIPVPTPIARAIVYLDNGHVFLGSHFGDSLLVRLSAGNPKIEVVHTLPNLAPISDFVVLGTETGGEEIHQYSSGQTMILTCSGGFFDGGLRSVRSGVGIQDVGILGEMSGVQKVWPLKVTPGNSFDDALLFSFAHESRVFSFTPDGDVEEVDFFENFSLDSTTLVAGNVGSDKLIQVTPSRILLVEKGTPKVLDWVPPDGARIDMASHHGARLAIVVSGRNCFLFDFSNGSIEQVGSREFDNELSSIHVPTHPFNFVIAGFWTPSSVALLSVPDLNNILQESLAVQEGSVPRSLALASLIPDKPPTLFIGMGDGEVFTYSLSDDFGRLSDQKRLRLGAQAVTFELLSRPGGLDEFCVIATGERPTMIYEEEGRIVFSAITISQATAVAPFHAENFPDTVVVASEEEVSIAKVDDVRTTHTRTSPLHQFARRVAFSREKRVYAVATIRNSIEAATDENFYDKIDAYELQPNELVDSLICTKLINPNGSVSEKFILGTAIGNEQDESEKGRLLVFEVGEDKVLRLVMETELSGACHSLTTVEGYLLAGLNKSIDLYRFHYKPSSMDPSIERVASVRAATIPVALSVWGTRIFVGDLVKGVMVLELVTGEDGDNIKLVEVCRQYGVSWITALEALDESSCISADSEGNLMLLRRETSGPTDEDTRRMQPLSELRLGEMVNCIRRVNDPVSQGYIVQPKAYLGTVEGGLFMLGLIHPDYFDLLMKCQANMAKVVKGIGDLDFNRQV